MTAMATLRHLRDESQFRDVRAEGRVLKQPLLTIFVRPNGLPFSRLGITTSKRVGKAVRRNRARRLVRESFRSIAPRLATGLDVVTVGRPGLGEATYQDVRAMIDRAAVRGGLYQVY